MMRAEAHNLHYDFYFLRAIGVFTAGHPNNVASASTATRAYASVTREYTGRQQRVCRRNGSNAASAAMATA